MGQHPDYGLNHILVIIFKIRNAYWLERKFGLQKKQVFRFKQGR